MQFTVSSSPYEGLFRAGAMPELPTNLGSDQLAMIVEGIKTASRRLQSPVRLPLSAFPIAFARPALGQGTISGDRYYLYGGSLTGLLPGGFM